MTLEQVISGGQTGADLGFLAGARALGIRTGGWAPRGWRTDAGPAPWLAQYGLWQHDSPEYPPRTIANVADATGVLVLGKHDSPGCRLTLQAAVRLRRPFRIVPFPGWTDTDAVQVAEWILSERIRVLDGAGNRERLNPGICAGASGFLISMHAHLQRLR